MVPGDLTDFFVASASAAGALIGLLFVALSVWRERDEERHLAESHRLRAAAALTVFSNALAVSLFALVPSGGTGETATAVGALGLLFILASGLRLLRLLRGHVRVRGRDLFFLAGGTALFVVEVLTGIGIIIHPHDPGRVNSLADLVAASLLFGIGRSWELIGGPQVGFVSEVSALVRGVPPESEPDATGEDATGEPSPDDDAAAF